MKTQHKRKQMQQFLLNYTQPKVDIYVFEPAGSILINSPGKGDGGGIMPDPGGWN